MALRAYIPCVRVRLLCVCERALVWVAISPGHSVGVHVRVWCHDALRTMFFGNSPKHETPTERERERVPRNEACHSPNSTPHLTPNSAPHSTPNRTSILVPYNRVDKCKAVRDKVFSGTNRIKSVMGTKGEMGAFSPGLTRPPQLHSRQHAGAVKLPPPTIHRMLLF